MAAPNNNPYVYFIFSDLQVKEETAVANSYGKAFTVGNVFSGSSARQYSKMITADQIDTVEKQYPDYSVVAKGYKNSFKYTEPLVS